MSDRVSRSENPAEGAVPVSVPDPDAEEHTGGGNTRGTRQRFGNVRKLPSGRLQARYTGPDGQEHRAPITFDTKGDAQTWLALQSAAITESRWKPAPPPKEPLPTFGTFADQWLDRRDLKPRTRSEYKRLLTGLKQTFGDALLDELTAAQVRSWHAAFGTTRKTARVHAYSLLRTILNAAVDEELLADNPCHIRGAGVHRSSRPIRPATLAELETIANAMPPGYRFMVHLKTRCALRFGELTELRRHDVVLARPTPDADAIEGLLHVRRAVTWVRDDPDKAMAIVGTPKSDAGVRDVAIPPHLISMLEAHLAAFAQHGNKGLLFPNTDVNHMHHGSLYKVYRPARKAAGREDLRWHYLRHTGATMAAQAGATTRELMTRLGHTIAGVAMRYQHAAADRDAEIARRLSKMINPETWGPSSVAGCRGRPRLRCAPWPPSREDGQRVSEGGSSRSGSPGSRRAVIPRQSCDAGLKEGGWVPEEEKRRDRQKPRRIAGLIMSLAGIAVTVTLAILGSQEHAPSASTQGLLAFVAVVSQAGATWLFSSLGRPDPALADRAVSRLYRAAAWAQGLTRELQDLFENRRTPSETHIRLGQVSVKSSFLADEIIAAIEDWDTFAPSAVAKTGALDAVPNPLQPSTGDPSD